MRQRIENYLSVTVEGVDLTTVQEPVFWVKQYKSASWGGPTKTSASFSVKADGTLSGLPSMSACDLLVTIGV